MIFVKVTPHQYKPVHVRVLSSMHPMHMPWQLLTHTNRPALLTQVASTKPRTPYTTTPP